MRASWSDNSDNVDPFGPIRVRRWGGHTKPINMSSEFYTDFKRHIVTMRITLINTCHNIYSHDHIECITDGIHLYDAINKKQVIRDTNGSFDIQLESDLCNSAERYVRCLEPIARSTRYTSNTSTTDNSNSELIPCIKKALDMYNMLIDSYEDSYYAGLPDTGPPMYICDSKNNLDTSVNELLLTGYKYVLDRSIWTKTMVIPLTKIVSAIYFVDDTIHLLYTDMLRWSLRKMVPLCIYNLRDIIERIKAYNNDAEYHKVLVYVIDILTSINSIITQHYPIRPLSQSPKLLKYELRD